MGRRLCGKKRGATPTVGWLIGVMALGACLVVPQTAPADVGAASPGTTANGSPASKCGATYTSDTGAYGYTLAGADGGIFKLRK